MRASRPLLALFAAAVAAQVAVPLGMIAGRELTLRRGAPYRFRTAPVDPADAFRGRFVALRLEQTSAPASPGARVRFGSRLCAAITNDAAGFAHFSCVGDRPPPAGDYLWVVCYPLGPGSARFRTPFDRYYLEESKAPRAERAYWDQSRGTNRNAWIEVRIRRGTGVISDLYIGGEPVRERLRRP